MTTSMHDTPPTGTPADPARARRFSFARWTALPPPDAVIAPPRAPERPDRVGLWERGIALILIVLVSPLLLLCALAVMLSSPRGRILYRQERVGLDRRQASDAPELPLGRRNRRRTPGLGMSFTILKFRTMVADAEKHTGPVWAVNRDPRITRVGRVLRQLRLDELPQLFNVLGGHMRLIGPRPERPHFVRQLAEDIPDYAQRLRVLPGITGLAQIEREYDGSVDDVRRKVQYDLFYVRNRSGLLDLKILLRTIDVMVRGRGAR
jgi:lipopolysaccharide/colanic/teichoic acid biosynthesis glycosyltransferase